VGKCPAPALDQTTANSAGTEKNSRQTK